MFSLLLQEVRMKTTVLRKYRKMRMLAPCFRNITTRAEAEDTTIDLEEFTHGKLTWRSYFSATLRNENRKRKCKIVLSECIRVHKSHERNSGIIIMLVCFVSRLRGDCVTLKISRNVTKFETLQKKYIKGTTDMHERLQTYF